MKRDCWPPEAKYKELIDTAPVAIFVFQNEKIVFFRKSAPEMSGDQKGRATWDACKSLL